MTSSLLPPISVALLNYNRAAKVLDTLEIVLQSDYPAELMRLVVIDNNSTDGTAEQVQERFGSRVEVLRLPENIGAVARNRAMMEFPEPYIFVFDEDCAPEKPDTLRRAVALLEQHPEFGALCLNCRNYFTGQTEYLGWERTARRRLPEGIYEGVYVAGNGMCFRRDAIQQTEGYDERFFFAAEELALSFEMLYSGVQIAYDPTIVLLHRRGPRELSPPFAQELEARNNIWAPMRYLPIPLGVPVAMIHTTRRLTRAVVRRQWANLGGVWRGVLRGLRGVPEMIATRRVVPLRTLARYHRWFFDMVPR